MVALKDKVLAAVMAVQKIPEHHFELIGAKTLNYTQPDGARLQLQGEDSPTEVATYTQEQLDYIKKIDDQIEILTLKKSQVVPVKVEKHNTRSYSVVLK
jgi:hypothetical protein